MITRDTLAEIGVWILAATVVVLLIGSCWGVR